LTERLIHAGDNLEAFSQVPDGSAQLVYMDPPFASGRKFEVSMSRSRSGGSERIEAFDDRWTGADPGTVERRFAGLIEISRLSGDRHLAGYLRMMLPRLVEARRVLDDRGALYLHCDPAASHYLKVALDIVFGPENFRNEVIWKRTHAHSGSRRYGPVHDTILFYSKSKEYRWNPTFTPYSDDYLANHFRQEDSRGRYQLITCTGPGDRVGTLAHYEWNGHYPPAGRHWAWKRERMIELDRAGLIVHSKNGIPRLKQYATEGKGVAMQDVWTDISRLDAHSQERVGYDTQKPTALLERIIRSSSEPGGLVIDPFAGSGTTAVAAEVLGRSWAAFDTSLLAASLTLGRVRQVAGQADVELEGFPTSVEEAGRLRRQEPNTYGIWGTGMLATVLDVENSTNRVVSGAGVIGPPPGPRLNLRSWVPMDSATDLSGFASQERRAEVGIVLAEGEAESLRARLEARYPRLRVIATDVSQLVSGAARRHGYAVGALSRMAAG
jgi:DNA modification methylase